MELKKELQNVLRVPQPEDVEKVVMMTCGTNYENASLLNPLKKFSVALRQEHRESTKYSVSRQEPPIEHTTSKPNHRRRKWNINTIIGHILLIVFHLVQWQKISQTCGISAEFLDEELE